jgi:hypothetical protein
VYDGCGNLDKRIIMLVKTGGFGVLDHIFGFQGGKQHICGALGKRLIVS